MTEAPLSRSARLLIVGDGISAVGTGLVLPLLLIYLHQVRHIPLATTGALLAVPGVVGLAAVPLSGIALDRFGARRTLSALLVMAAVAAAGLAEVHSPVEAIPVLALFGISQGSIFPAYNTMLAGLVSEPAAQQRAFAINFTGVNAGIGIGSLIGGLVVNVHRPATFETLFLGNGVSYLLFLVVLRRLPDVGGRHPGREWKAGTGSYRDVLRIPSLRLVVAASLLLAITGYASLDAGLPAYATVEGHVTARVVALSLAANTGLIVVSQLVVLRVLRRWRRSTALAVVGATWAVSWLLLAACAAPLSGGGRDALVVGFAGLFGVGETFMAPTMGPLLNSLACDDIRGRANAMSSSMYAVAFVVAPSVSAGLIAAGLAGLWIGVLCAGCLGTVWLATTLRRRLPQDIDRALTGGAPSPQAAALSVLGA